MLDADLTDREIDNICAGLTQNAAMVRYLREMKLTVRTKPNGRPLVNRAHYDAITGGNQTQLSNSEPRWSIA